MVVPSTDRATLQQARLKEPPNSCNTTISPTALSSTQSPAEEGSPPDAKPAAKNYSNVISGATQPGTTTDTNAGPPGRGAGFSANLTVCSRRSASNSYRTRSSLSGAKAPTPRSATDASRRTKHPRTNSHQPVGSRLPHTFHLPGPSGPCCPCSSQSGCKTNGCTCRYSGIQCTCCASFDAKCTNRECPPPPPPLEVPASLPAPPVAALAGTAPADEPAAAPPTSGPTPAAPPAPVEGAPSPSPGDLPSYQPTAVDRKLDAVFGDHVHSNPGTHLDGGIADDAVWQAYFGRLVAFHSKLYSLPARGPVARRFLQLLISLIHGIVDRAHNSEKFLLFPLVVLQRQRGITKACDIKRLLSQRMDAWEAGQFSMLVQETARVMGSNLATLRGGSTAEQRFAHFDRLMKSGSIRAAVRYITEREQSGVLQPTDVAGDDPSGLLVHQVLQEKHPSPRPLAVEDLPSFPTTPEFVTHVVSADDVAHVAARLHGAAGLCGTDSRALSFWLLGYKDLSSSLRTALARLAEWMANSLVDWAAIRALMSNRLIALDKAPGVRPIGIGQIWRRTIAKCVLRATGDSAATASGADQLCVGLSVGAEAAVHTAQTLWRAHADEADYGFLLIDARNAFNEMDRSMMLWNVRHLWPQGAVFAFNCYRHHALLIVHDSGGRAFSLHSKIGVTQGCPLAMILCGLGLLPMIRELKARHPTVVAPWFADDGLAAGTWDSLKAYSVSLAQLGPSYGYFFQPAKSELVVYGESLPAGRLSFASSRLRISSGTRYLGGFLGDPAAFLPWLTAKVQTWAAAVDTLAAACALFPQSAYCGLQKSLQMEWQCVQRTNECTATSFAAIEHSIAEVFLPVLFRGSPVARALTALPVKAAGLALPDPTRTTASNYQASTLATAELTSALRGASEFALGKHHHVVSSTRAAMADRRLEADRSALEALKQTLPPAFCRVLTRAVSTGQFLQVLPCPENGTVLSRVEYCDAVALRYGLTPPDLPARCDGCNAAFDLRHALSCKCGGLVILRHNDIRDELGDLFCKGLSPSQVRDEPRIYPSRAAAVGDSPPPDTLDARGDLLVRSLYQKATDCVLDVQVSDLDARTYRKKPCAAALRDMEKAKKRKHLAACLQQRRTFVPFVVSADGLIGAEADAVLQQLSRFLAQKWDKPYSTVRGYVTARMSFAIARGSSLCLRGSRVPSGKHGFSHRPQWDDAAAALALHQEA